MKKILTAAIVLTVGACVSGPEVERKSPLNVLSGEHYEGSPPIAVLNGVPVNYTRKEKSTTIEGIVFRKQDELEVPLASFRIGVFDKAGKKINEITSNMDGSFSLKTPLKNGTYFLRPMSERLKGERSFTVDKYEIKDLRLVLESI